MLWSKNRKLEKKLKNGFDSIDVPDYGRDICGERGDEHIKTGKSGNDPMISIRRARLETVFACLAVASVTALVCLLPARVGSGKDNLPDVSNPEMTPPGYVTTAKDVTPAAPSVTSEEFAIDVLEYTNDAVKYKTTGRTVDVGVTVDSALLPGAADNDTLSLFERFGIYEIGIYDAGSNFPITFDSAADIVNRLVNGYAGYYTIERTAEGKNAEYAVYAFRRGMSERFRGIYGDEAADKEEKSEDRFCVMDIGGGRFLFIYFSPERTFGSGLCDDPNALFMAVAAGIRVAETEDVTLCLTLDVNEDSSAHNLFQGFGSSLGHTAEFSVTGRAATDIAKTGLSAFCVKSAAIMGAPANMASTGMKVVVKEIAAQAWETMSDTSQKLPAITYTLYGKEAYGFDACLADMGGGRSVLAATIGDGEYLLTFVFDASENEKELTDTYFGDFIRGLKVGEFGERSKNKKPTDFVPASFNINERADIREIGVFASGGNDYSAYASFRAPVNGVSVSLEIPDTWVVSGSTADGGTLLPNYGFTKRLEVTPLLMTIPAGTVFDDDFDVSVIGAKLGGRSRKNAAGFDMYVWEETGATGGVFRSYIVRVGDTECVYFYMYAFGIWDADDYAECFDTVADSVRLIEK